MNGPQYYSRFMAVTLLSVTLAFGASGCAAPLLIGLGVGVVGGYVVSPDTVEGSLNYSMGETWDAAKEITQIMGQVVEENEAAGQIVITIGGARVTVTLYNVSSSTTRLSVKARKSFMPKIDVAQDVYTKIVNSLAK